MIEIIDIMQQWSLCVHSLFLLPMLQTSLLTFMNTFPSFQFPSLLLTIRSSSLGQSMHAQYDWINPIVYSYFSTNSLLPISSNIDRPMRYKVTSFWQPSKSHIFNVVSRLSPRLNMVKNHQIKNNYDFICSSQRCLATSGWHYLSSTSNTLQYISMLLSSKLYIFLKNLLHKIKFENILNASILPTTIVSIITGYVMPCTQLISGRNRWNIYRIYCTSALRTSLLLLCRLLFAWLLLFVWKSMSILLLNERIMSRWICDFTWGQISCFDLRSRSQMQRTFVMPNWFQKIKGQILWRCSWGMNFFKYPIVFCLNLVGLEI